MTVAVIVAVTGGVIVTACVPIVMPVAVAVVVVASVSVSVLVVMLMLMLMVMLMPMIVRLVLGNDGCMAVPTIFACMRVSTAARVILPRFIARDYRFRRARRRCIPPVVARPKALREHKPRPESLDHGRFLPKVTQSLDSL